MPHRRPSRSRTRVPRPLAAAGVSRAVVAAARGAAGGFGVESLEARRLLTTLTAAAGAGPQITTYLSLTGGTQEIIYNDVTFEAITMTAGTAAAAGVPAVASVPGNLVPIVPAPGTQPPGQNLFKIYVTDSHTDSFIAITAFDPTTGHYLPYSGAVPAFISTSTAGATPYSVGVPGNTGAVVLGATTDVGTNSNGLPSLPLLSSFGVQPAPEDGELVAGIEVAPLSSVTGLPNNFGNFLLGGTVYGQVSFGGNVNEFYAGNVFTGVLTGGPGVLKSTTSAPLAAVVPSNAPAGTPTPTATPAAFANFSVAGDLQNFIVRGMVGTDGAGTAAAPLFVTDFAMTVGGTLGNAQIGNAELGAAADLAGTITVSHDANIASGVAPTTATATTPAVFNPGDFVTPTEVDTAVANYVGAEFGEGEVTFSNGTAADAQVLQSFPVLSDTTGLPVADASGNLVYQGEVDGTLDGLVQDVGTDAVDYYAASFLAGQTFTVTETGGAGLVVFDPDGRAIASNAEAADGTPVQVVADRPGRYTFELTDPTTAPLPYTLVVTGVGDQAIGGITVNGFYTDDGYDAGLVADRGDIGTIQLAGNYASLTTGPTPSATAGVLAQAPTSIGVYAGTLRAFTAAAMGIPTTGDPLVLTDGAYLNVPFGSVGLVQTTVGVLNLETQFDPGDLLLGRDVTNDAYATAIGGSVQVIDCATKFQTDLAADAGVGTIRAGDMATDEPSVIDVNADDTGSDGIIDLIQVLGQMGTLGNGGPQITTNDGGQVRYMQVSGTIFRDALFGGTQDDPINGGYGTVETFTDQAGNKVTVTPVGPVTFAGTTTTTTTTGTTTGTTSGSGTTGTTGTTGGTTTSGGTTTTGTTTTGTTVAGTVSPGSTVVATAGPVITMVVYPVRDKGGDIPISLASTGGMEINAADTAGNNGEVDVGSVSIAGTGRAIVATGATDRFGNDVIAQETSTGTLTTATTGTVQIGALSVNGTTLNSGKRIVAADLIPTGGAADVDATDEFLLLTGESTVNVLSVTATGVPTAIVNTTKGEIVSLTAPSIGTIQTVGNLGFATPEATAAAILPRGIIANGNAYPFAQQHTGVVIGTGIANSAAGTVAGTGDAVSILVGGAVANVQVGGTLQTLVANYGGNAPAGQMDGITGPIVAARILNTDIGQGIAYRGSGNTGVGLFATDQIGAVTNFGNPGADIRGDIISGEETSANETAIVTQAINEIDLVNGSLIDARIYDLAAADFIEASDLSPYALVISGNTQPPNSRPYLYDVGTIAVSGAGGIIGTDIEATDIDAVIVAGGGFGILYSEVGSVGLGRINEVVASGYGIRDTLIDGGGYVGPVTASGNGALVPTTAYPLSVRASDNGDMTIDPTFGMYPSVDTDINDALGLVTGSSTVEADVTDTGVIEDDTIDGLVDFAGLTANRIRTATPEFAPSADPGVTPVVTNIPVVGTAFPNSVSFGGVVGLIRAYSTVDGLQVTAGHVRKVNLSNDVSRLGIAVAGPIDSFLVHGNVGQTITDPATGLQVPDSYIDATGPAGSIPKLTIFGSLFANVDVVGTIGTLNVYGDVDGSITAQGNVVGTNPKNLAAYSVNTLRVTGGIRDGSLAITGRVNQLVIDGGLGSATGTLGINGSVNLISVGANRKPGAKLALALTVGGTVQRLDVFGQITGAVHVLGDVRSLDVTGDGTTPDAIAAPITVDGRLYNATVTDGNVAADVTVNGDLYNFTVVRGDIAAGATIQSSLASIHQVRVLGGAAFGIAGSVLAPSGTGLNVTTTGSLGGGTAASTIEALSAGRIMIGGDVVTDAAISIVSQLDSLFVGGNIQAGATVAGHPIRSHTVRGTTTGTLTVS